MSKSSIEDYIESAKNKNNSLYLRKGWIIRAESLLNKARIEIEKLKESINKEEELWT